MSRWSGRPPKIHEKPFAYIENPFPSTFGEKLYTLKIYEEFKKSLNS